MTARAGVSIAEAVRVVEDRVARACERAGRPRDEVTIIAAAKTMPFSAVREAIDAGIHDIGENRVQEAVEKVEGARRSSVRPTWHFIGHLQRNKARIAAEYFDVVHSVDSERLLHELDRHAAGPIECFVQVNVAGDESKFGVPPADAARMVKAAEACQRVHVTGLMTIGPLVDNAEQARPHFRALRTLARNLGLPKLSMGMTGDFEVAIEEGATHVRIGRAIFGERDT